MIYAIIYWVGFFIFLGIAYTDSKSTPITIVLSATFWPFLLLIGLGIKIGKNV